MKLSDAILMEIEQEGVRTRNLLEIVPGDKLGWQPHHKSMTLGQLSLHIADGFGFITKKIQEGSMDIGMVPPDFPAAQSVEELLATYEEGIQAAKELVQGLDDAKAALPWKLMKGEKELLSFPVIGVIRYFMLNHLYHHRGQLVVYLRILDVTIPAVYGMSKDDNPFANI